MCGILGFFNNGQSQSYDYSFEEAINLLNHRGPDDQGYEKFEENGYQLLFGHTRLSIIDLSKFGHQPMSSKCKRYSIVFNGEIYNYIELRNILISKGHDFRSNSDTEVLLSAWSEWQEESIPKLKGMFSFVIYDRKEKSIIGVRDAFGIKPLFYYQSKKSLYFSSEIPSLLKISSEKPSPNWQTAYDYLTRGNYDAGENTFFEGIKHLLPGHLFRQNLANKDDFSIKRWWWPSIEEKKEISFNEASDQLKNIFLDNIRIHLRSDVEIGAALSGGIDSSAVVCSMRHLEPDLPIHTFSYIARGSTLNEERWIDKVNKEVNAIPHKVEMSSNDLSNDIDQLIRCQGEPFGSTSIYAQYKVFQKAKEENIIVTLDGQGADEMLAGYYGYPDSRLSSILSQNKWIEAYKFLKSYCDLHDKSFTEVLLPYLSKNLNIKSKMTLKRFLGLEPPPWINKSWCRSSGINPNLSFDWKKIFKEKPDRSLSNTLRYALTGRNGLVHLLRHEDRNAMHWSVESRVPFLTTDLAEFVLSLPEEYLISNNGRTKNIFREAMRGIVPDSILNRKDKIGFETPEKELILDLIGREFGEIEIDNDLKIFDFKKLKKNFSHVSNNFLENAWRVVNFQKWYKTYF